MIQLELIAAIQETQSYFERSISTLTEEHSEFAPVEGAFTAAQMVAHVALSIDWFVEGAFHRPEGFSMDFESMDKEARSFTSLKLAKAALKDSFDAACSAIKSQSTEQLLESLPEGPVMGGLPRKAIVSGIEDHTAHHRGALTVYARLNGLVPPMPYM